MGVERSDAPPLIDKLRAHGKASDSIAWNGQARQLLLWAADAIEAANVALSETAPQEAEIKKILQDACDRDWKDETLYQTANIAANAIYWRGKKITEWEQRAYGAEDELNTAQNVIKSLQAQNAASPNGGEPLIPMEELQQMLSRAEMAAEVTLPIEKFRDIVLQAMEAT